MGFFRSLAKTTLYIGLAGYSAYTLLPWKRWTEPYLWNSTQFEGGHFYFTKYEGKLDDTSPKSGSFGVLLEIAKDEPQLFLGQFLPNDSSIESDQAETKFPKDKYACVYLPPCEAQRANLITKLTFGMCVGLALRIWQSEIKEELFAVGCDVEKVDWEKHFARYKNSKFLYLLSREDLKAQAYHLDDINQPVVSATEVYELHAQQYGWPPLKTTKKTKA